MWKACDAQVGDDFHINPEEIETKYYGVLTKIFNVARFASQFDSPNDLEVPPVLSPEDVWILAEFDQTLSTVHNAWSDIDIYNAAQSIKSFATGIFPSHWLEMSKSRIYDGDASAIWTLHRIFRDLLSAFTPICPFFTHLSPSFAHSHRLDARNPENTARSPGENGKKSRKIGENGGN